MTVADFSLEAAALGAGAAFVVGVDEVGRGPLAGPVTAAAVRLDPGRLPVGLKDSKAMTALARERMFDWLMAHAQVSVAHASVDEIDTLNILRASHLAMERAVAGLPADHALVDGNLIPKGLRCTSQAIVKGDAKCLSIAAASVIQVARWSASARGACLACRVWSHAFSARVTASPSVGGRPCSAWKAAASSRRRASMALCRLDHVLARRSSTPTISRTGRLSTPLAIPLRRFSKRTPSRAMSSDSMRVLYISARVTLAL